MTTGRVAAGDTANTTLEVEPETRSSRVALWQIGAAVVAVVFVALLVLGLYLSGQGVLQQGVAPDFEFVDYLTGKTIRLSDYTGQIVVVNIWASWCEPCRDEAPILEKAWRRYRDQGVMFLGVDYLDTEREARAYIAEFDLTYPNGPDVGSQMFNAYRAQGVPETFFIDRQGRIRDVFIGPMQEPDLIQRIERLLAE